LKLSNAPLALIYKMPSNLSRRALFFYHHHRFPRVGSPVTFNEKINWRILKDRREILAWTCDKLAMKDYVSKAQDSAAHDVRVPRTWWTGTDVSELANIELPEHWVLKPNHRSGGQVFFGHGRPDLTAMESTAKTWLRSVEGIELHEWAYTKARPLLLVEDLLGMPGSPPSDYKFYVFAGEVAAVEVHSDRFIGHRLRWYLPDWTPLAVSVGGYQPATEEIAPPANFEKMVAIAGELGRPFDFMRVDLYSVDGEVFFGELSPYPGSGIDPFVPNSFDDELGAKWELPLAQH
jgi:TupA-like ATPgrasp